MPHDRRYSLYPVTRCFMPQGSITEQRVVLFLCTPFHSDVCVLPLLLGAHLKGAIHMQIYNTSYLHHKSPSAALG